ncbi:hypothetical protein CLV62_104119 [Dysgonomonas alginatilytica]|uniref:SPP1 gp7 family phage head morphogenesis protein n=1 Tax=Dysgonomonas alginatilytica TaxID=1605892 RepID=A0A2V3PTN9_9BACT|nr:hypothetical protein [Dysgonomonas alginatilytica]PXV66858.1 hypothetical protein CLV62_104119 [Dysgonomonas alginatilytica]
MRKGQAEAIKYMERVIDQMALSDADLKAIIQRYTRKLIDQAFVYAYLGKSFQFSANSELDEKVSSINDEIRKEIFNIIYTRCKYADTLAHEKEAEEKSDKFLLLFLGSVIAGQTLQERINRYVSNMSYEIEAYIAAGLAKGMSRTQVLSDYLTWFKSPYKSPLLLDAFRKQGFKAERILSKGITFGSGIYISSFDNLVRLEQQTIFHAYNNTLNSIWLTKPEIIGWYTIRGSAYPCTICDDNVGVFHSKDEFFSGYHVRCCCILIPVYNTDII